jgi:hypothetical protein
MEEKDEQKHGAEEIDLNNEETEALDRVWAEFVPGELLLAPWSQQDLQPRRVGVDRDDKCPEIGELPWTGEPGVAYPGRAKREGGPMTEAEWLAANEPTPMLEFLREKASNRKLRLFACACCRLPTVWPLLMDNRSRRAVEIAESFADAPQAGALYEASALAHRVMELDDPVDGPEWLPLSATAWYAWDAAQRTTSALRDGDRAAALLREVFGNPFRPDWFPQACPACRGKGEVAGSFDVGGCLQELVGMCWACLGTGDAEPLWCTDRTALALAGDAYDRGDFACLPVLGDALEDAGCTSRAILEHLRGPGPHVRGCWVVDLILGKQ